MQTNRRVLCPVRGLTPVMSADQSRVLLPLHTGARTIIERGRTLNVKRHPLASISDVTLLPFERSDLRNPDILQRAAGLIRSVGYGGERVRLELNTGRWTVFDARLGGCCSDRRW